MPSSDLIAQSGYTQEYVNAMLQYYRQQAASAYKSSGSGGGSNSTASTSTSSSCAKPGVSGNTGVLVSVPQYGEISVADAERLVKEGLVRRTGVDKYGRPTYAPTAKKPSQNIQLSR